MAPKVIDIRVRFDAKWLPVSGPMDTCCWRWLGGLSRQNGYGRFWNGRDTVSAHRVAYTLYKGPIPVGLQIDHLCRNRWCVNPDHLEPVTCRENLLRGDSFAAVNAVKTHCPQGHPLRGDNLVPAEKRRGRRVCAVCRKEYERKYRKRRKRGG